MLARTMDELQASFYFTRNLSYVNTILTILVAIAVLANFFRRQPSLETVIQNVADKFEAALDKYALSKDVIAYEKRYSDEQRRMRDTVDSIKDRFATKDDLTALETRLGSRVSGLHDSLVYERKTSRQESRDWQAAISSLNTSVTHLNEAIRELRPKPGAS